MPLAEHDQVVRELTPKRSDEPFGVALLPRRSRRDAELLDAQLVHPVIESSTKDPVAIANQEPERAVLAKGFDDLVRRPRCVWVACHVDVKDATALERQDDEHVARRTSLSAP
jgi:hypothetical protein